MREYVWLECNSCGERNYRVQKETRGRAGLGSIWKKYCRRASEAYLAQGVAQEVTRDRAGRFPAASSESGRRRRPFSEGACGTR